MGVSKEFLLDMDERRVVHLIRIIQTGLRKCRCSPVVYSYTQGQGITEQFHVNNRFSWSRALRDSSCKQSTRRRYVLFVFDNTVVAPDRVWLLRVINHAFMYKRCVSGCLIHVLTHFMRIWNTHAKRVFWKFFDELKPQKL